MATGVVSTSDLQGVNKLPASASSKLPELKPGEVLFSCATVGMRVVMPNGESRFFTGGYLVARDAEEAKFMRGVSRATEVKSAPSVLGKAVEEKKS